MSVALRPEDMERAAPGADNAFDALVTVVEYGGNGSLLRVKTAFGKLWARVAGECDEGERISLRVPPSRTLVYDAGRRNHEHAGDPAPVPPTAPTARATARQQAWLVTPALIVILALFIYPFAYGLALSFQPMNGGSALGQLS